MPSDQLEEMLQSLMLRKQSIRREMQLINEVLNSRFQPIVISKASNLDVLREKEEQLIRVEGIDSQAQIGALG